MCSRAKRKHYELKEIRKTRAINHRKEPKNLELKNTKTELKNSLERFNSRKTGRRTDKHKEKSFEIIQSERKKE
jgi:hypothetical protein